jgi:predicted nucleic acid-binding protein
MLPAPFRVVLDANVLFPFSLRDTLLRAAAAGYYQIYWSEQILEEARRNLVQRGVVTVEQAEKLFATMRRAFPEAEIRGYEPLVDTMLNAANDRHVAAAAVKVAAQVIVTFNLRDFHDLPDGINSQSPSDFLVDIFNVDPGGIVELLREQAAALKRPRKPSRSCSRAWPRLYRGSSSTSAATSTLRRPIAELEGALSFVRVPKFVLGRPLPQAARTSPGSRHRAAHIKVRPATWALSRRSVLSPDGEYAEPVSLGRIRLPALPLETGSSIKTRRVAACRARRPRTPTDPPTLRSAWRSACRHRARPWCRCGS